LRCVRARPSIDLELSIDAEPVVSETTCTWAGAHVLTVHTVVPRSDLALELHSTFVGHPGLRTQVVHLRLGPPGHEPTSTSSEVDEAQLEPTYAPNHFAQATYDYTRAHTGTVFAAWMRGLAKERRFTTEGCDILCVHGSPLVISDFLWESLDDDELLGRLDAIAPTRPDVLLGTHTGLPWSRRVGGTLLVNVGAIGRPANDGRTDVWFAVVDCQNGAASARLEPLAYDWRAQAASMRAVGLPEPFVETIETGWDDVPGDRAAGRARPRALPRLSRAAADGLRAGRRWVD